MTGFVHAHAAGLRELAVVVLAVIAVGVAWWLGSGWRRSRAYSRRSAAHCRPEKLADPVWGDTAEHDASFARAVAEYDGANPVAEAHDAWKAADGGDDYATTMLHTGSLLEPLPPYGHPYPRAWEQDRPVRTVNLPPWEVEEDPRECCVSCGAEVDHYLGCPDDPDPDYEAEAEYQGRHEPPLGATHRDGMTGGRGLDTPAGDRSPESGSLSPTHRKTPASATAGRAPEDLPGPRVHALSGEQAHRAGKARRIWSGLLGAPDPQNLAVPGPHGVPRTATAVQQQATGPAARDGQPDLPGPVEQGQGHRAGQPDLAGQDVDTGVLTGEIHPGPPPPDDDEAPTVTITVISAADTGPWQDDGWLPALPPYVAEHLPDGCQSTSDYLDALFDGITDGAQLALTGGPS